MRRIEMLLYILVGLGALGGSLVPLPPSFWQYCLSALGMLVNSLPPVYLGQLPRRNLPLRLQIASPYIKCIGVVVCAWLATSLRWDHELFSYSDAFVFHLLLSMLVASTLYLAGIIFGVELERSVRASESPRVPPTTDL